MFVKNNNSNTVTLNINGTRYQWAIGEKKEFIGNLAREIEVEVDNLNDPNMLIIYGSGDFDLEDLLNVEISSPSNDENLTYNSVSEKWENKASSGGGVIPEWNESKYINKASTSLTEDGSFVNPFKTFAAAMTDMGNPSDAEDAKTMRHFKVAPGRYDEAVTVPAARRVVFWAEGGSVVIGDGAADSDFNSTVARDFIMLTNQTKEIGGARPFIKLGVLSSNETSSTHIAYAGGWIISGDFKHELDNTDLIGGPYQQTTHDVLLESVKVQGDFNFSYEFPVGTPVNLGATTTCLYNCFFDKLFQGDNLNVSVAHMCEFDDVLDVTSVGRLVNCEISKGVSAYSNNNFVPPEGFINCFWKGSYPFTRKVGGGAVLKLDTITNYWFNTNSGSLAGGATRTLLHEETV